MSKRYLAVISLIVCSCFIVATFAHRAGQEEKKPVVRSASSDGKRSDKEVSQKEKEGPRNQETKKKKEFKKNQKVDSISEKRQQGKKFTGSPNGGDLVSLASFDRLKDGKYRASAMGYAGPIQVEVTISDGKLADIQVLSHSETPGYYERGLGVISRILNAQSVSVDAVSGATYTSRAIMVAVSKAISQAGVTDTAVAAINPGGGDAPAIEERPAQRRDTPLHFQKYKEEEALEKINIDLQGAKDGLYKGKAEGFNGENEVSVKIVDGKIQDIEIKTGDDPEYFTDVNRQRLLSALKNDVNIKHVKDIDGISGATYSSGSILRAVKAALKEYKTEGYGQMKVAEGITVLRNHDKGSDHMKITKNLPVYVTVDGVVQKSVHLSDTQYVKLERFNKNSDLRIVGYDGNVVYEGKAEGDFQTVSRGKISGDLKKIQKETKALTYDEKTLSLYMEDQEGVSIKKVKDPALEGKKVKAAYDLKLEGKNYILSSPKYGKDVEFWQEDAEGLRQLPSYEMKSGMYALAKGSGRIYLAGKDEKTGDVPKQIRQWIDAGVDLNYFVRPPMPDEELKDGRYVGYGYGYKAGSAEDRWNTAVTIRDGEITQVEILNQPDDAEYVEYAKKFQDKVKAGKLNKNTLIGLHTYLEKFYALEPSVQNKFNGELPVIEGKTYLKQVKETIGSIEPDAVAGATISTTGITRSIMDALNKSALAKKNENTREEVTGIAIKTYPKTAYQVGETLDLSGLVITLSMNTGTELEVGYADFQNQGISISHNSNEVLNEAKTLSILIRKENAEATFTVDVTEKSTEDTYVRDYVGNYDSPIFVRPPELNAPLRDGEYIGHGKGYYYDTKYSVPTSYVQTTKVKMIVEGGKVKSVEMIDFGDDVGGGGMGYKARGAKFRASANELVKKDTKAFIKQHLDFERFFAAVYTKEDYPMFEGDTTEKVSQALRGKMQECDAVSGATCSNMGYSRAVAEALYKASLPETVINDMWLEDYENDKSIYSNLAERNKYFGKTVEERRRERIERGYHQNTYYPEEIFNTDNLVLHVSYTDGTETRMDYQQMLENGFDVYISDYSVSRKDPLHENRGVPTYVFKRNMYNQILNIRYKNATPHIKSEYANSNLYSNFEKP